MDDLEGVEGAGGAALDLVDGVTFSVAEDGEFLVVGGGSGLFGGVGDRDGDGDGVVEFGIWVSLFKFVVEFGIKLRRE